MSRLSLSYQGFSFLEILVSIVILSIGLLALAHLDLRSIQRMDDALFASIAETQLQSIRECLLANRCGMASNDEFAEWNRENQQLLPAGNGRILTINPYLIRVSWRGQSNKKREDLTTEITC